ATKAAPQPALVTPGRGGFEARFARTSTTVRRQPTRSPSSSRRGCVASRHQRGLAATERSGCRTGRTGTAPHPPTGPAGRTYPGTADGMRGLRLPRAPGALRPLLRLLDDRLAADEVADREGRAGELLEGVDDRGVVGGEALD